MRIDVVTIFPEYLAPLDLSLIGRARRTGLLDLRTHDLRDFTHDRHRTVDDTPYGGGAGMVMKPEPWGEALEHVTGGEDRPTIVLPGPGGEPFTQRVAKDLARRPHLVFGAGRYEGIDERVYERARELGDVRVLSLGDYVLNGGEVAVLAMVEAIVRLIPGVIGNAESLVEESHEDGLLEYPVYTKPADWRGRQVPEVLLSGDHGRIERWRDAQRLRRTAEHRPDLLSREASLDANDLLAGLRPAVPADAGELLTLTHACWLKEAIVGRTFEIPALHETLEVVRASLSDWRTDVVRSEGRLIASVRGRLEDTTWHIGRLMVAPDLQGKGLGRALLEHIQQVAPPGATTFRLITGESSRDNQRLYRKAGFRKLATSEVPGAVAFTKRRA